MLYNNENDRLQKTEKQIKNSRDFRLKSLLFNFIQNQNGLVSLSIVTGL